MFALPQEVRWNTLADSLVVSKKLGHSRKGMRRPSRRHRHDDSEKGERLQSQTECGGLPRADDGNHEGTRPRAVRDVQHRGLCRCVENPGERLISYITTTDSSHEIQQTHAADSYTGSSAGEHHPPDVLRTSTVFV